MPTLTSPDKVPTPFTRLGPEIFRPLASPNRELMWALLLELYDRFFGPDSQNPDEGYAHRTLTESIEGYLDRLPEDEALGDDPPGTPINVRANNLVSRLIECGWLQRERFGAIHRITMRPVVGAFLELLRGFAEDGPTIIGGEVQMIFSSLKATYEDPEGHSSGFAAAASRTRSLITLLNHTSVRVRELMAHLGGAETTAAYIKEFFESYVQQIFVADYHDLRTKNHPLQRRNEILEVVASIRFNADKYEALKRGYRRDHKRASDADIERMLQKDFNRLQRFDDVEVYLDRLDAGVARATRQGLTYLQYKLRTPGRLEKLLTQVGDAAIAADADGRPLNWPFLTGKMFGEGALRLPRQPRPPRPRTPLQVEPPNPLSIALMQLLSAAAEARTLSPEDIRDYVAEHCAPGKRSRSADLPIRGVKDFLTVQLLGRLAWLRSLPGGADLDTEGIIQLPAGTRIRMQGGDAEAGEFLVAEAFEIERN